MTQSQIKVVAIKAFSDNYIWALHSATTSNISLVDPGDAEVCIRYIEDNSLILSNILITHHHADHTGGIKALKDYCQHRQWPLNIYGPAHENIPCCQHQLVDNDVISIDNEYCFKVIELPGHTLGHIAYFSNEAGVLFCGDTLFSGGCGRIFEGTAQQMHHSLCKLSDLPEKTRVYCAHEYTLANLNFALTVDPNNPELIQYYNQVTQLREHDKSTIPTSILVEKSINPFLRCHTKDLQHSAQEFAKAETLTPLETFTIIRRWKDNF
ncbi:hydroxyacylglutathione hydrolase [Colwelliaceae bacterium 6471]